MKRALAEEVMACIKALDTPMHAAAVAIEKIDDPDERKLFRKAIASVAGLVYTDVIVEIQKRFPDLAVPDE